MKAFLLVACGLCNAAIGSEAVPPREVQVLPVFFVPKGEPTPTDEQADRLIRHLEWARTRYRELLRNEATFGVAEETPRVDRSERELAFYRTQPENSAPQIVSELLTELNVTRYNCPYVLLVVMMNPQDSFPVGGGRPLNGGLNTGGGIVVMSSFTLDRSRNFQSTLQHELGHAFGLPHVNVYGYDMKSNESIMSYNRKHHTNGFRQSPTPGKLIPEDLRGLALNQRVFPGLRFDARREVPRGYSLAERIVTLGPMKIPDQPDGVEITTESGEQHGSKVANVVQGRIATSLKTGKVTFDAKTMWHSAKTPTGWVSVQVAFPYEVELSRVVIHSQHSGMSHAAQAVRISAHDSGGHFHEITRSDLRSADDAVTLPPTTSKVWRFEFQAGPSGYVVLRGLQFFAGDDELFPPLVPASFE